MKKKRYLYLTLVFVLAWLLYFDVSAYIHLKSAKVEYMNTLREYEKTEKHLKDLKQELKELRLQIENSGNDVTQTNPSTGTQSTSVSR